MAELGDAWLADREDVDREEEEEEEREARRAAATKKEVLRLTGTAMCELSFLFGLRQEGSLHAPNKVTCLALQADAFQATSA